MKRDHNEDTILVDADIGLYAVCDGMGGHAGGEVASRHAAQTLQRELKAAKDRIERWKKFPDDTDAAEAVVKVAEAAVNIACAEIYDLSVADKGKAGMGTTLVALLVVGGKGVLMHVGDSRLYMVRSGQLHQLTEDHSYTGELVKRGKLTREEAAKSPFANVITRAVGIQRNVQVDTLQLDILPGDTYLLCSDGLHGYTTDPNELADALAESDLDKLPDALVSLANNRGGKDNISAVVVRAVADAGDRESEEQRATEINLKLDTLKKIPLFRYLTYQELVKVLNITSMQNFTAGKEVITEGKTGEELYIILSGRATVSRAGQDIVELHAGVHFGEMALVDQSPRSATVTTKEATKLLVVERKAFYGLIRKEPVLAVKLLWSFVQVLSRRLRETNEQLSGARLALEGKDLPFFDPNSPDDDVTTTKRD